MITFKKGDGIKYIDPESDLIPTLLADGWQCSELNQELPDLFDDIENLKAKAKELGIKGWHFMKPETLEQRVKEALYDNG